MKEFANTTSRSCEVTKYVICLDDIAVTNHDDNATYCEN